MRRTIEDSRGRIRSIFPVAAPWVDSPAGPPVRATGAGRSAYPLLPLGALLVVLAGVLPGGIAGVSLVLGVLLAIGGVALLTLNPRRPAPAYAAFVALLNNGYCPSCAYGIDTIRPEHDGCTVCPECGAAWRR